MITADDDNPDTFRIKIWETAGETLYMMLDHNRH